MLKKPQNDELFQIMDWVLKKKGSDPISDERMPQPFVLNRWLSMVDPSIAHIINATTNRWILVQGMCSDKLALGKFYKKLLPKTNKKYSYIKKPSKEKAEEEKAEFIKMEEISNREFELYKKTLADLGM